MIDLEQLDELLDEASRLARSDPEAAGKLLEELDGAARAGPPDAARIVPAVAYLRARLTLERGEPRQALALIDVARDGYQQLNMPEAALRTSLGRMHALDDLGRHAEAVTTGQAALAELDRLAESADSTGLRAAIYGNIGIGLGFTGQHEPALAAYRQAEKAWHRIDQDHDVAMAIANQGVELSALGRAHAALERLDLAAAGFEAAGDTFWLAKCLGHQGQALSALGRFVEALAEFDRARDLLSELGVQTEAWRLAVETAAAFVSLGLRQEAITVLGEVEPALRQAELHHDLADARWLTGTAELDLGRPDAARTCLSESAELFRVVGDVPGEVKALLDLSRCVPPDEAAALVEAAAALVGDQRRPGIQCLISLRLAEIHGSDAATERAHLDEAERLADELGLPHLRQVVSQRRGSAAMRQGDLDAAITLLDASLTMVERASATLPDAVLRAAFVGSRNTAQDHLVLALLDRARVGDVERAAELADLAKGRILLDVLSGSLPAQRSSPDPESADLDGELGAAYSALFTADRATQRDLRARIDTLERRIAVQQTLKRADTGQTGLLRTRPRGRSPSGPTASLAYHLVGEEVLALVTVDGVTTVRRRLTDRATVQRLVEDLESHVGGHAAAMIERYGQARLLACQRVLQELYLAVLAPVIDLLPAAPDDADPVPLLVVPHGPLSRVPFHALHDGRGHLLERWLITLAPSLAAAGQAAAIRPRAGIPLILAVTDSATPFIGAEARAVTEIAGDTAVLLLGERATFGELRARAPEASMIHFACHGLFRPENAAFSSLQLADRWIRGTDVAELDLDGTVLVLSACETGRVHAAEGEEAVGLARSFLAAGARSVVVSQWLADDRSTADLMVALHRGLANGRHPAAALRSAQLAVMKEHPHPFHWAPFVVAGAPTPEDHR